MSRPTTPTSEFFSNFEGFLKKFKLTTENDKDQEILTLSNLDSGKIRKFVVKKVDERSLFRRSSQKSQKDVNENKSKRNGSVKKEKKQAKAPKDNDGKRRSSNSSLYSLKSFGSLKSLASNKSSSSGLKFGKGFGSGKFQIGWGSSSESETDDIFEGKMTAKDKDDDKDPGFINATLVNDEFDDVGKENNGEEMEAKKRNLEDPSETGSLTSLDTSSPSSSPRFNLKMSPVPKRTRNKKLDPTSSPVSFRSGYQSNRSSISSVRKGILKKTNSCTTINMEMANLSRPETPTENGQSVESFDEDYSNGDMQDTHFERTGDNPHLKHQRSFNRVKFILDSGRPDNITGDYDDIKIEKNDKTDKSKVTDQTQQSGMSRSGRKCMVFSAGLLIMTMAVILGSFFGSRKTGLPPKAASLHNHIASAVEGRFKILNENFVPALYNYETQEFKKMSKLLEDVMVKAIFVEESANHANSTIRLRVVKYEKGSVMSTFRIKWEGVATLELTEIRKRILNYLGKYGAFGEYKVDKSSFSISELRDLCDGNSQSCSHICMFSETNLRFGCTCPDNLILVNDTNCIAPELTTTPKATFSDLIFKVLAGSNVGLVGINPEKKSKGQDPVPPSQTPSSELVTEKVEPDSIKDGNPEEKPAEEDMKEDKNVKEVDDSIRESEEPSVEEEKTFEDKSTVGDEVKVHQESKLDESETIEEEPNVEKETTMVKEDPSKEVVSNVEKETKVEDKYEENPKIKEDTVDEANVKEANVEEEPNIEKVVEVDMASDVDENLKVDDDSNLQGDAKAPSVKGAEEDVQVQMNQMPDKSEQEEDPVEAEEKNLHEEVKFDEESNVEELTKPLTNTNVEEDAKVQKDQELPKTNEKTPETEGILEDVPTVNDSSTKTQSDDTEKDGTKMSEVPTTEMPIKGEKLPSEKILVEGKQKVQPEEMKSSVETDIVIEEINYIPENEVVNNDNITTNNTQKEEMKDEENIEKPEKTEEPVENGKTGEIKEIKQESQVPSPPHEDKFIPPKESKDSKQTFPSETGEVKGRIEMNTTKVQVPNNISAEEAQKEVQKEKIEMISTDEKLSNIKNNTYSEGGTETEVEIVPLPVGTENSTTIEEQITSEDTNVEKDKAQTSETTENITSSENYNKTRIETHSEIDTVDHTSDKENKSTSNNETVRHNVVHIVKFSKNETLPALPESNLEYEVYNVNTNVLQASNLTDFNGIVTTLEPDMLLTVNPDLNQVSSNEELISNKTVDASTLPPIPPNLENDTVSHEPEHFAENEGNATISTTTVADYVLSSTENADVERGTNVEIEEILVSVQNNSLIDALNEQNINGTSDEGAFKEEQVTTPTPHPITITTTSTSTSTTKVTELKASTITTTSPPMTTAKSKKKIIHVQPLPTSDPIAKEELKPNRTNIYPKKEIVTVQVNSVTKSTTSTSVPFTNPFPSTTTISLENSSNVPFEAQEIQNNSQIDIGLIFDVSKDLSNPVPLIPNVDSSEANAKAESSHLPSNAENFSTSIDMTTHIVTASASTTPNPINSTMDITETICDKDFKCSDGVCISMESRCDSVYDCQDRSDEKHCIENKCLDNYQCRWSGDCLARKFVCDGVKHCTDGDDEEGCENWKCSPNELRCSSGSTSTCIPLTYKCDGHSDCFNRTDELNCTMECPKDKFLCPEGSCIPNLWKCDGRPDCLNGEDELECGCEGLDQSPCAVGGCVPTFKVCDGLRQCPDGSDEWGCLRIDDETKQLQVRSSGGRWSAVCGDKWTAQWTDLVCEQLGFDISLSTEVRRVTESVLRPRVRLSPDAPEVSRRGRAPLQYFLTHGDCDNDPLVHVSCKMPECGKWNGIQPESILQSQSKAAEQWPSLGLLIQSEIYGGTTMPFSHSCPASIITPTWVLTSYSCLASKKNGLEAEKWALLVGEISPKAGEGNTQLKYAKQVVIYPGAKRLGNLWVGDAALLRLQTPLTFGPSVQPICLSEQPPESHDHCVIASWTTFKADIKNGMEERRNQTIKSLPIPNLTLNTCNTSYYKGQLSEGHACASFVQAKNSPCTGNEGAPLMCRKKGGSWQLYGLMSHAGYCANFVFPSVFTDVSYIYSWLFNTIGRPIHSSLNLRSTTSTTMKTTIVPLIDNSTFSLIPSLTINNPDNS